MKKRMNAMIVILIILAMSVSAFAEAVPSPGVEKTFPTIKSTALYDKDGNLIDEGDGLILITPYEEKDDAAEEIRIALEDAFKSLTSVDSLGELIPEKADSDVVELFQVTACKKIVEEILAEGGYILVIFKDFEMDEDQTIDDIYFKDEKWFVGEDDTVSVLEDNELSFKVYRLGSHAFAVSVSGADEAVAPQKTAFAQLFDKDGNLIEEGEGYILVTVYEKKDEAVDSIRSELEMGYDSLTSVESLSELSAELEGKNLFDVFHVTGVKKVVDELLADNGYIVVQIDEIEVDEDQVLGTIEYKGEQWISCKEDAANVLEKDLIAFELHELGLYAFVVD